MIYQNAIKDWGLTNGTTLFIEIIIGIVISLFLLWTAKTNELKMEKKVDKMSDILKKTERSHMKKSTDVRHLMLKSLNDIDGIVVEVLSTYKKYDDSRGLSKQEYEKEILTLYTQLVKLLKTELDDPVNMNREFFSDVISSDIRWISKTCKNKPNFSTRSPIADSSFYDNLHRNIIKTIEDLHNSFSDYSYDHVFTISTDQSVYPLESKIYVQANIRYAVDGIPIEFEIVNSKEKMLDAKTVNIEPKYLTHPESGIYEIDFKMKGDDWKVGEEYTVRATYGKRSEEYTFTIDQRTPVIQTDKGVYMIDSDMIVTVIDPDSDKDSEVVEYVGDHKGSKLTITTEHGTIDTYRLEETGDSTGIFQGVIGILGKRKDGTTIPFNTGTEIIKKTQGTGDEDGYIEASPGDEITLTYQYGSKTVSVLCFVAAFEPIIKLDKKIYKPNDKMEITVIDPDHKYEADASDKDQKKISVNVKIGTNIPNDCQLFESDEGLFVGETSLRECTARPDSQTSDAVPCCRDGDSITVSYAPLFEEPITAKASVKA